MPIREDPCPTMNQKKRGNFSLLLYACPFGKILSQKPTIFVKLSWENQPPPMARSVLLLQGKFFGTSDVDLENRFIPLRNPDALFCPASGRGK